MDIKHDTRYSVPSVQVTRWGCLHVAEDQIFFFFGDDCISFSNVQDRVRFLNEFKEEIERAIREIS